MSDRIGCCIPFCRRTAEARPETLEWICPKHWATTSKRLRAIYRKRCKRYEEGDESQLPKIERLWMKLKSQAMDGGMF